jgi:hypothetical protein
MLNEAIWLLLHYEDPFFSIACRLAPCLNKLHSFLILLFNTGTVIDSKQLLPAFGWTIEVFHSSCFYHVACQISTCRGALSVGDPISKRSSDTLRAVLSMFKISTLIFLLQWLRTYTNGGSHYHLWMRFISCNQLKRSKLCWLMYPPWHACVLSQLDFSLRSNLSESMITATFTQILDRFHLGICIIMP